MPSSGEPVRPVAVLDACVLIPAALRDLLLSCADVGVFRPVWQEEILNEVKRNGSRLLVERNGLTEPAALAAVEYILSRMADAFPDAIAASSVWVPLVPNMTCNRKDRHVLAVAVGTAATLRQYAHAPRQSLPRRRCHAHRPITGAKGLNLAVSDVALLARALTDLVVKKDGARADAYSENALRRVWRATHFSWWMTSMLHTTGDDFDAQLQLSQLRYVATSRAAAASLAENYTGMPISDDGAGWSGSDPDQT